MIAPARAPSLGRRASRSARSSPAAARTATVAGRQRHLQRDDADGLLGPADPRPRRRRVMDEHRQRRGARALRRRRPRPYAAAAARRAPRQLRLAQRRRPDRTAAWTARARPQLTARTRLLGPQHGRLHRRLRLRRDARSRSRSTTRTTSSRSAPASPYLGFTDTGPACRPGRPGHLLPRSRTRARSRGWCPPTARRRRATLAYMRSLGVRRLVRARRHRPTRSTPRSRRWSPPPRRRAGIDVAGRAHVATGTAAARRRRAGDYAAARARPSRPRTPTRCCSAARPTPAPRRSGSALHAAAAGAPGCSRRARSRCRRSSSLGAAAAAHLRHLPYLEPDQYPPAGAARLRAVPPRSSRASRRPSYALYGYEAMEDVLAAIRAGGPLRGQAARRCRSAFFHLGVIHGVIGTYRILPSGDTSLDSLRRLPRRRRGPARARAADQLSGASICAAAPARAPRRGPAARSGGRARARAPARRSGWR